MADAIPQQTGVPDTTSSTVTVVSTDTQDSDIPTVRLKLRKPKNDKKVQWTTETVDNEDMNKKKSKCCCIYNKPRKFDDSSSEEDSDEECDHCQGHVEKKKHKKTNNESLSCNVIAKSVTTATTTTENEIETIIPVPESSITN